MVGSVVGWRVDKQVGWAYLIMNYHSSWPSPWHSYSSIPFSFSFNHSKPHYMYLQLLQGSGSTYLEEQYEIPSYLG